MALTITFIRHAPTSFNRNEVFMGIQDIPCGIKDLEESNISFSGIEEDSLYCSPLKRAKSTAEYLFPNTKPIIDNRLVEKNLGDWAGKSKTYLRKLFPDAFLEQGLLNPFFTPPNGESFEELKYRSVCFLKDIIEKFAYSIDDKRVFVVTHNGVIRTIRSLIEDIDPLEIFETSELYLTPIDYTFELMEWNAILKT